jgi:excisionase family DNA binding protein
MPDSADQLAAAIRRVIDDSLRAALRLPQPLRQPPPPLPPEPPKPVEDNHIEWPPERMLYPLREIQQRLSISRSTVYQLVGNGQLPSVKIGRRRFVTAAALDAYIEGLK